MIRISPIRLIGSKNEQIGVIETHEAMRMAEEQGLDLVEVVSDSRPPVCKIMDYGKHKYELSKKKQPTSKGNELKEIRLGRSIKIDKHDIKIRTDQARRFLMEGHKVQVIQRFKGREFAHKDLGLTNLRQFFEELEDIAKVEQPPKPFGRQFTMLLSPDKPKVESARNKLAKQAAEDLAEEQARLDAQIAELDARDAEEAAAEEAAGENEQGDTAAAEAKPDKKADKANKTKKGKQRDTRGGNPVDDEIAELLGE